MSEEFTLRDIDRQHPYDRAKAYRVSGDTICDTLNMLARLEAENRQLRLQAVPAPAEPERELTPEQAAELQADFDAWKAGRDNREAVLEAARKVAESYSMMDGTDELDPRHDIADQAMWTALDALAALLPAERAEKETK